MRGSFIAVLAIPEKAATVFPYRPRQRRQQSLGECIVYKARRVWSAAACSESESWTPGLTRILAKPTHPDHRQREKAIAGPVCPRDLPPPFDPSFDSGQAGSQPVHAQQVTWRFDTVKCLDEVPAGTAYAFPEHVGGQ